MTAGSSRSIDIVITELRPFVNMPPCTAKELLHHAKVVLRALKLPNVQQRTLRFYIAQGLVPSPIGSAKFARYDFRHLESLVRSRLLQDQGLMLNEIRKHNSPQVAQERKVQYDSSRKRINLFPGCRLEIDDCGDIAGDLQRARAALDRLIKDGQSERK